MLLGWREEKALPRRQRVYLVCFQPLLKQNDPTGSRHYLKPNTRAGTAEWGRVRPDRSCRIFDGATGEGRQELRRAPCPLLVNLC